MDRTQTADRVAALSRKMPELFEFGPLGHSRDPKAIRIPLITLAIGMVIFLSGMIQLLLLVGLKNAEPLAEATVSRVFSADEGGGSRFVSELRFYAENGEERTIKVDGAFVPGQSLAIVGDLEEPIVQAEISLLWPFTLLFVAALIIAPSAAAAWANIFRKRAFEKLLLEGVKTEAKIQRIVEVSGRRKTVRKGAGVHSFQENIGFKPMSGKVILIASWYNRVADSTLEFVSERIVSAPEAVIGAPVDVYRSAANPRVYFVDLASIRLTE